jgi:hypothetical protein
MAEKKNEPKAEPKVVYPDTPSGRALAAVGDLNGEDVEPGDVEAALAHGEAYQAEKKKHRWG